MNIRDSFRSQTTNFYCQLSLYFLVLVFSSEQHQYTHWLSTIVGFEEDKHEGSPLRRCSRNPLKTATFLRSWFPGEHRRVDPNLESSPGCPSEIQNWYTGQSFPSLLSKTWILWLWGLMNSTLP